uniref:Uncharacterized protein LOC111114241 n=1 Tax=Crassostrea virginica TaxID=6565 RepID=A0A8B8BXW6_CRAVI|nr:uncharacterized protein LOC111114241 [Crassostrea virginica]
MPISSAPPLTMDPRHSAQDVVRCVLCRDAVAPLYSELNKQGEALHKEINTIKPLVAIEKQEAVINKALNEIKQVIVHLKGLLETSDIGHVSKYKSRNRDFRKLPPKLRISLPNFQPQRIDTQQLLKQFGPLSSLSIETEEQGYTLLSPGAESSPPARPLLDIPRLITDIPTIGYEKLFNVSCLRNWPQDIALTQSGGLVYADYKDSSINLVSVKIINKQKLCVTLAPQKKQSIQWDTQGKPLYSSGPFYRYLSENRNLDICVADYDARAVVVVSAAGKLRFRYTGSPSTPWESFSPFSITTDSQGNILTSDCDNHCIHIIDQDGHFLRFIHNCGLQRPRGLFVDSQDNLYVAEVNTGKVKKIMYYN